MNPALLITIIQLAIKAVPSLVAELRLLLAKGDPTDADWDALKEKVSKTYEDYIADATQDRVRDLSEKSPPATGG